MSYLGNLINQDDKDLVQDIARGATVISYHEEKQGEDTITDRESKRIIRSRQRER